MSRVRIGVTSSSGSGTTSRVEKVGRGYLDALAEAGGVPVVLPTVDPSLAIDALRGIDALVLTGGGDVDPARYGALTAPETGPIDPARDAWELALVAAALAGGLPVLAICRGAQVVNVACGGTLVQHLPHRTSAEHDDVDRAADEVHHLDVVPESRLAAVVGAGPIRANTIHHQSIDRVGRGLVVCARAEDGVVEAVESVAEPVLAVQWHPELLTTSAVHRALFEWVVEAAESWARDLSPSRMDRAGS